MTVNGKTAPILSSPKIDPDIKASCTELKFNGFVGELTDLNIWNTPLDADDLMDYSMGCSDNLFNRIEPKSVFWQKLNYTKDVINGPMLYYMKRKNLCNSESLKLVIFSLVHLTSLLLSHISGD